MLSAARGKVWMSEGVFRNTADISDKFPERYNRQKISFFTMESLILAQDKR